MDQVSLWACSELTKLGLQDSKQIVSYLIKIDDESSTKEYLTAMLDTNNVGHKNFITEFMKKVSESKSSLGKGFYRKQELNDDLKADKLKNKKDKSTNQSSLPINEIPNSKKKNKFVSLYSKEGESRDVVLLTGRHRCDCQASKHRLINNCLKCGRIVCEQEGSGPCAFCNNLVISKEEKEIISKGTKKADALHNKLLHSKKINFKDAEPSDNLSSIELKKAIEHKNKLLEYDQTSEKRTKVYDDENDYFQSSSKWLNPANRDKLQKLEQEVKEKKYARINKKFTIDLLGRKLVEGTDDNIVYGPDNPIIKELLEENSDDHFYKDGYEPIGLLSLSNPVYIENSITSNQKTNSSNLSNDLYRIQDKGLQEMDDRGMCLSMHQPYASLLIEGIKVHEGRNWYSSHRGRLWIASAAKVPDPSEIAEIEQQSKAYSKNKSIKFPLNYPSSCLLGCVDVVDVLSQEEYRRQFPNGESNSPYVFICENFKEMAVKFPIKGEHKIYKLDSKVHAAAKKSLRD